jgi:HAD superfamily hydrolase (TIGR01509 family)
MNSAEIHALAVDAGGVIRKEVDPQMHRYFQSLLQVKKDIYEESWNQLYPLLSTGQISEDEFFNKMHSLTKSPTSDSFPFAESVTAELGRLFQANKKVLEMIRIAKDRGYKLALASNSHPMQVRVDEEKGMYDIFNVRALSHEIGVKKPDPNFFDIIASKLSIQHRNIVLIDDRKKNIEGAMSTGMQGIIFINTQQMRRDLRTLGVDIAVTLRPSV